MPVVGSRLVNCAEKLLGRVGGLAHRKPAATLALVAAITGVGLVGTSNVVLDTDLTALLPDTFQSVQDLDRLRERFGGVGYCVIIGRNAEPDALIRFADDLAPKVEALPNVRFVMYERPIEFFEDRALLFLDEEDLKIVAERLAARENWERQRANPLYLDLEDEAPPDIEFNDLRSNYEGKADASKWVRANAGSRYYLDEKNSIIALMAKPSQFASELTFAREVVESIRGVVNSMDLKKYGPNFEVHYAGRYAKRVDQQKMVERDLSTATTAAVLLVVLYLMFHFRRLLAVVLIMVPLVVGLLWTFSCAYRIFGNLNILTAFIGAILLGLGIDHGIHLLQRFGHEFAGGEDADAAVRRTFSKTGRVVIVAAVTTTVAFGGLAFSEFRAFHEFGTIAACGMVLVVISYTVCLPALLSLALRFGWKPRDHRGERESWFAARLPQLVRPILVGTLILLVIALVAARQASFNFDFGSLQGTSLLSYQLDKQVDHLLGYSQIPVVVLTDSAEEERAVVKAMRLRDREYGKRSRIDFSISSTDLVPQNQEAKIPHLRAIGEILERINPKWIEKEHRSWLAKAKRMTQADPFGMDDMPINVHRQLRGPNAKPGTGFALIFPNISLDDGEEIRDLAEQVRGVHIGGGRHVSASGESMILADILEMVDREAMPVLMITAIAVFLTLLLLMGSLRDALLCLGPAVFTLILTVGLLPLVNMRVNYLNMIMIPVIFGISVDGAAHLITRVRGGATIGQAVNTTGRAIAGAMLTTSLGFGAMVLARQPGLASVGELAALGMGANLVVCLVALPAFLVWLDSRKREA